MSFDEYFSSASEKRRRKPFKYLWLYINKKKKKSYFEFRFFCVIFAVFMQNEIHKVNIIKITF
jgi:hypothetical protein